MIQRLAFGLLATIPACAAMNNALWFNGSDQQVNTGGDCQYDYIDCDYTTMGYWQDFDDRKYDNGGSYISYPYDSTGYYGSFIQPMIENLGYLMVDFTLKDPVEAGQAAEYPYNFAGMSFNTVDQNQTPMNIKKAKGLCATYTSDYPVVLEVESSKTKSSAGHCSITLPKAKTPTMVSKLIADFKQPSWIKGEDKLSSCAKAFESATKINFKIDGGASEVQGRMRIFEVGPAGKCHNSATISPFEPYETPYNSVTPAPASSSSEVSSSNSSYPVAGKVNKSIWFIGSDQQVNTGGDCDYEYDLCASTTMGYWYDYDDRKNDKGGSYISYPFDTTGYYGSRIQPMIEEFGYIAVDYTLKDPVEAGQRADYPYNFVGMSFNTVNSSQDPLDITDADGLCMTYTSDHNVTLEVVTPSVLDAHCQIVLPKATTPNMVSKAINDFKQPTWAKGDQKISDCSLAFAAASRINVKIDGGAAEIQGRLRIFEIGPKGTCRRRDYVPQEPTTFCYKSDGVGGSTNVCSGNENNPNPIENPKEDPEQNFAKKCWQNQWGDTTYVICNDVIVASVYTPTCSDKGFDDNFWGHKKRSDIIISQSKNKFFVSTKDKSFKYEVFDMQGGLLRTGYSVSTIDLSEMQKGSYFLKVKGSSTHTQQIHLK